MSGVFQRWMINWDITHRPSSAYFPHSNNRAETAAKSSKRMLQDCVSRAGSTDNNKFVKAILQYRNTPHQDCRRLPAQMVFGRTLRVYIPCLPYKYAASADWLKARSWPETPINLKICQSGLLWPYRTKWDKTGVVMEVKPHEQIAVKVDGNRRLTLRNRRFVRELDTGKTSSEDCHLMTSDTSALTPRLGKTRQIAVTPSMWPAPQTPSSVPIQPEQTGYEAPAPISELSSRSLADIQVNFAQPRSGGRCRGRSCSGQGTRRSSTPRRPNSTTCQAKEAQREVLV